MMIYKNMYLDIICYWLIVFLNEWHEIVHGYY